MNKSTRSILTAISAIVLTLINGLFGLIVTKLIIVEYGSDFNGLNSTATQFINMLLLIEGGVTIATNVALFKPMAAKNYEDVNRILSATRMIFNKIGISFFIVGTVVSIMYALIINTELSPLISFSIFVMAIVSTSFNLAYATKYRILLQSENKEYILNGIQIVTLIISQFFIIAIIFSKGHMLSVRFITMLAAIINSIIIAVFTRKKYTFLDFNVKPDHESIKGTKDIFIQKLTSVIYSTIPVIFISGTIGTIYASIYLVYNNVFQLLKSVIYAFINAPVMGFGKLLVEKDLEYVLKIFLQYEFIVIYTMFTLLSTGTVLIMPFISIYTAGIIDANYYNWYIALFLIFITFFEIIHIPSGNIINMSGKFEIGRKIQVIAIFVFAIVMIVANIFYGFYGILLAVLVTAILLAVMEVYYIHCIYFQNAILKYIKILVPNLIVMTIISVLEIRYLPPILSYLDFFIAGIVLVIFNALVLAIINFALNRDIMSDVIERIIISIGGKVL